LRAVVRVDRPAVVAAEGLSGVLTHDLSTGLRLSLGQGVAVSDVEDQRGWLAHWLDADQVVRDELGVALSDHGQREPGEVGQVVGGGDVFGD